MSKKIFVLLTFLLLVGLSTTSAKAAPVLPQGTLIIEQLNTEFRGKETLGSWGLATPVGVIEGDMQKYMETKDMGNYALTVESPPGAIVKIEVYNNDNLTEAFDRRTANGILGSGGTLRFNVIFEFNQLGNVAVTGRPAMPFKLKTPYGEENGTTNKEFNDVPVGSYTVYFQGKNCPTPRPQSRDLKPKGRIAFDYEEGCDPSKFRKDEPKKEEPKKEEPKEEEPKQQAKKNVQKPIRVSLTTPSASREVAAGGSTQFGIGIVNRSDVELKDLTVDYRYDSSQVAVRGARSGQQSNNAITWTIASLPAGAKWQTTFTGTVNEGIQGGQSIASSVTVSGDGLSGITTPNRSDTVQFSAIQTLPETGRGRVPLDLMIFFVIVTMLSVTFGVSSLGSVFYR